MRRERQALGKASFSAFALLLPRSGTAVHAAAVFGNACCFFTATDPTPRSCDCKDPVRARSFEAVSGGGAGPPVIPWIGSPYSRTVWSHSRLRSERQCTRSDTLRGCAGCRERAHGDAGRVMIEPNYRTLLLAPRSPMTRERVAMGPLLGSGCETLARATFLVCRFRRFRKLATRIDPQRFSHL